MTIGRVAAPWGIKGEVRIQVLTDFPDRFSLLERVYLGPERVPFELESARQYQKGVLLKFRGYDTPEAAGELRGLMIEIPLAEAMPLGPAEYYEHQIIGLEAWTVDGEYLGTVDDILYPGSADVYVIKGGEKEILIPAIESIVVEIDLDSGRILIQPMEGLL